MSLSRNVKSGYVTMAQGMGRLGKRAGLLHWLDARRESSRTHHWLRSLFAIHDIEALVDLDVPWWTYEAIDRMEVSLEGRPQARVFEYGSGASTVWLARRAASVTSVEHVPGWHARVQDLLDTMSLTAEVTLRLVEPSSSAASAPFFRSEKPGEAGQTFEAYARAIEAEGGTFDVIVIDGRARQACLAHAAQQLAPGGIIVFDNSHRSRYRRAIDASGLAQHCLRGLTPSLPYPDQTTLLTHPPEQG